MNFSLDLTEEKFNSNKTYVKFEESILEILLTRNFSIHYWCFV